MQAVRQAPVSRRKILAGRIITALTVLFLLFDGAVKVLNLSAAVEPTTRLGYPAGIVIGLGMIELACVVAYLLPRTSVLGAVLLTGYLGGATATHVRIGDPFFFPVVIGIMVWAGLYLREERLRPLLPLRRSM